MKIDTTRAESFTASQEKKVNDSLEDVGTSDVEDVKADVVKLARNIFLKI